MVTRAGLDFLAHFPATYVVAYAKRLPDCFLSQNWQRVCDARHTTFGFLSPRRRLPATPFLDCLCFATRRTMIIVFARQFNEGQREYKKVQYSVHRQQQFGPDAYFALAMECQL
jgi:hypothetical protein